MTTTNPDSLVPADSTAPTAGSPLVTLDRDTRHPHRRRADRCVDASGSWPSGSGFSPADRDQGEAVRILYVHVPSIWVAYLAFVVTAIASAMVLFLCRKFARIELARLGPPGGRQRRDRRAVHGRHPGRGCVVGSPHVGRLLAVGRPPDDDGAAVRHLHRLPRRAAPRRHPPAAGPAQRGDRAARGPRDPARPLERAAVAQLAPGGHAC